jgi:hypothetical protein
MFRSSLSKKKRVHFPTPKLTDKEIRQKRKEDALALAQLAYDMYKQS